MSRNLSLYLSFLCLFAHSRSTCFFFSGQGRAGGRGRGKEEPSCHPRSNRTTSKEDEEIMAVLPTVRVNCALSLSLSFAHFLSSHSAFTHFLSISPSPSLS